MYRDHTVGVVVPAYNEEGFIGDVIREMPDYVDRIFVIDDCSTDGTWDEIHEAAEADREEGAEGGADPDKILADGGMLADRAVVHDRIGRVVPIQHRENLGAGGAIKTGYLAALEDTVDIVPTVDGDGQMDLSQLSRLLDPVVEGDADYAKGNRLLYSEYREDMPRFRFIGNAMLTILTKIASGYWKTMDPQNGYTAISRDALEAVEVENLYEYYGYCNDLLVKLNVAEQRVADVAIPAIYGEEESSIQYSTYIPKVSWMLLQDFLWRLKIRYLALDFHPLALFYLFGAGVAFVGVVGGVGAMVSAVLGGQLFVPGLVSFGVFMLGWLFMLFAMVFDMRVNEGKESQFREQ
jgi:glycosyltransferase involved in cell wall biosynthesis